jgi:hypothetical protein
MIARILAALCAMAAGIGHIRFCAQFGVKQPTQSRLLLGLVILIFGTVSIVLGSIAEYQESGEPSPKSETVPIFEASADLNPTANKSEQVEVPLKDLSKMPSAVLVGSFFSDLFLGSADALVPFCIGCFLEILPLAALLLTVHRRLRSSGP